MTSKTLTASFDSETSAASGSTAKNFATATTITLQSSPLRIGFFFFTKPFPDNAVILSAVLNLNQKGVAAGGSRTVTVQRSATTWTESLVTNTNKPLGVGSNATCNFATAGVDGRVWAFDVQPLLAEVAAGGVWFGFRIKSDNATALPFYSSNNTKFKPTLTVTWSTGPATPTDIHPSNGRAISIARPTITFGTVPIGSYRLQLNTSDVWTSPATDTGQFYSAVPQHLVTSDVTPNVLQYGRVMVWDANGVASAWSNTFTFIRTAKGTLAITLPADTPNNFVNDATPLFAGTFSGTLKKFQMVITSPTDQSVIYGDSGLRDGSTLQWTPKVGALTSLTTNYRLYVRAWDDVNREGIGGDPAYAEVFKDFTFVLSNTVSPVTSLVITTANPFHTATASWNSTTAPDLYRTIIDGVVTDEISPADTIVSGTSNSLVMANLTPRIPHTVSIVRVVNGVASAGNPTASIQTTPEGIWLSEPDGSNPVCISNGDDVGNWQTTEQSVIVQGINAEFPALITQTLGTRKGDVSGWLSKHSDIPGVTQADWETRLRALAKPSSQLLRIALSNTNLAVRIYGLVISPADQYGDILVSFSFITQDDA